jgi:hypothetical protein
VLLWAGMQITVESVDEGEWEMGYYDSLYGYGTVIFLMKGLCSG